MSKLQATRPLGREPERPVFLETYTDLLEAMSHACVADEAPGYVCLGLGSLLALVIACCVYPFRRWPG